MTLDEQLQRRFETAASRLREEIARELQVMALDVAADVQRDRESAIPASRLSSPATVSLDRAASTRLVEAFRALDQASGLGDVLDTLVTAAGAEAARVGLLLAARGELRGRRFMGFGQGVEPASSIVLSLREGAVLSEAIRTGVATTTDSTIAARSAPGFAAPGGSNGLAMPITMSGEVVAVLYADEGTEKDSPRSLMPTWSDAIELLARHAARCLEARTALQAVRVLSERPQPSARAPLRGLSSNSPRPVRDVPSDEDESAPRHTLMQASQNLEVSN